MGTPDGRFWNRDTETLPRAQQREHQWQLLQRQLRYAYDHSPYYRRHFDDADANPHQFLSLTDYFESTPFLKKEDIIADQAKAPPHGSFLTVHPDEIVRLYVSPGPIVWSFTAGGYRRYCEAFAKGVYLCGARRSDVVDVTPNYAWVPAGTFMDDGYRMLGAAVLPGSVGMSDFHVEVMKLAKVTIIHAFTTFLAQLGEVAKQKGYDPQRDLAVRLGIIGGEIRSEAARRALGEPFGGIQIREQYGTAEVGMIANECEFGGGMHMSDDHVVEVIDPATGKHVDEGASGELVVSDVWRQAMPIIRYRTGDLTEGLNLEPCPCGRTAPRMKRIIGRVSDIPRIKGMFVVPRNVQSVLDRFPELGRFQLIVDRPARQDELTIKIVLKQPVDREALGQRLIAEIREAIRLTAAVEFVDSQELPEGVPLTEDRRMVD
ncbi:MAG: phenylacetate--CoA ligase family protein [Candidatus Entotheonellia bacterium]